MIWFWVVNYPHCMRITCGLYFLLKMFTDHVERYLATYCSSSTGMASPILNITILYGAFL
jgi:hypothetical protein